MSMFPNYPDYFWGPADGWKGYPYSYIKALVDEIISLEPGNIFKSFTGAIGFGHTPTSGWGSAYTVLSNGSVEFAFSSTYQVLYICVNCYDTLSPAGHSWHGTATGSATWIEIVNNAINFYYASSVSAGVIFSSWTTTTSLATQAWANSSLATFDQIFLNQANAKWLPCFLINPTAGFVNTTVVFNPAASGTTYFYVLVPEATNRGSKKLYLNKMRITLSSGTASDHITNWYIFGYNSSGRTIIASGTVAYNGAGTYTIDQSATPVDCSSYNQIALQYSAQTTTPTNLAVVGVEANVYFG